MGEQQPDNRPQPNSGLWIALGVGIGTAFGVASGNIPIGVALGAAVGAALAFGRGARPGEGAE